MTTDSTRSRILEMLTSLKAVAEAAPIDVAGAARPFTLEEMLTLARLEADLAGTYSETMRLGIEAREHLDLELVRACTWRFETAEETAASDAAAMVRTFSSVSG